MAALERRPKGAPPPDGGATAAAPKSMPMPTCRIFAFWRTFWPPCDPSLPARYQVGCGGDRDRGKRSTHGRRIATRLADVTIVNDDNPRTEVPAEIRAAIMAAQHRRRFDRRPPYMIHEAVGYAAARAMLIGRGHTGRSDRRAETLPVAS